MRMLVTGAAGFIGSHLAEALLDRGDEVVGIDCFTDYYARERKDGNAAAWCRRPGAELHELDLAGGLPAELLAGADVVFHLAAQPGVRGSFGEGFERHLDRNVRATQRLLEDVVRAGAPTLVFASSSSVYGEQERYPVAEDAPRHPHSPYGVTKLACEALLTAYCRNFGLRAVSLRYFTVFGPRQRPDMAFARFLEALRTGEEVPLFGGGRLRRDYTYVGDAVDATLRAPAAASAAHPVYNVGGGNLAENGEVVRLLEEITGLPARIRAEERPPGDVRETGADVSRARRDLGYAPRVGLREGLERQARA